MAERGEAGRGAAKQAKRGVAKWSGVRLGSAKQAKQNRAKRSVAPQSGQSKRR